MESVMLGRFGDARLQKGGSFCMIGFCRLVVEVFLFVVLAAIAPARCGLRVFFGMRL